MQIPPSLNANNSIITIELQTKNYRLKKKKKQHISSIEIVNAMEGSRKMNE